MIVSHPKRAVHERQLLAEAVWKQVARHVWRNDDRLDRSRIDYFDFAKGQRTPEFAPSASFHTASAGLEQ